MDKLITHVLEITDRSLYMSIAFLARNDSEEESGTITDFMIELLPDPMFRGCIILAHNGGAYDCKFILQYLEENLIPYSIYHGLGHNINILH